MDYYPSIYVKNNTNYDDLGLPIVFQDAYEYFDDQNEGRGHTTEYKMGLDGKKYPYGSTEARMGTYEDGWYVDHTMTEPAAGGNQRKGIWKVAEDPKKLGRRQIHGEIITIKEVELFENINPLSQDFLNAKVEGRLECFVTDAAGEQCVETQQTQAPSADALPEAGMEIPTGYRMPAIPGL